MQRAWHGHPPTTRTRHGGSPKAVPQGAGQQSPGILTRLIIALSQAPFPPQGLSSFRAAPLSPSGHPAPACKDPNWKAVADCPQGRPPDPVAVDHVLPMDLKGLALPRVSGRRFHSIFTSSLYHYFKLRGRRAEIHTQGERYSVVFLFLWLFDFHLNLEMMDLG